MALEEDEKEQQRKAPVMPLARPPKTGKDTGNKKYAETTQDITQNTQVQ